MELMQPRGGVSSIRAFSRGDVASVAHLRRLAFSNSRWSQQEDLERQLALVFLENPWVHASPRSLVMESATGEVAGFLGVIPRPFTYRGRSLMGAVATQLMVAPDQRGRGVGSRLLRHAFEGPQDILLSDIATSAVRAMWERLGGSAADQYGFYWKMPLRKARHAADALGGNGAVRLVRRGLRPLLNLVDRAASPPLSPPDGHAEELRPAAAVQFLERMQDRERFRAVYDTDSLAWLLDRLSAQTSTKSLLLRQVRDAENRLAGWFVLRPRAGRTMVLSLVAEPGSEALVLGQAMIEAFRVGTITLEGRFDPLFARQLRERRTAFRLQTPGLLVHARDADLTNAILAGRACLTGLEGEWWLGL